MLTMLTSSGLPGGWISRPTRTRNQRRFSWMALSTLQNPSARLRPLMHHLEKLSGVSTQRWKAVLWAKAVVESATVVPPFMKASYLLRPMMDVCLHLMLKPERLSGKRRRWTKSSITLRPAPCVWLTARSSLATAGQNSEPAVLSRQWMQTLARFSGVFTPCRVIPNLVLKMTPCAWRQKPGMATGGNLAGGAVPGTVLPTIQRPTCCSLV